MASELAGLQVDLAGDGPCDSPGYSAKYMTYSEEAIDVFNTFHFTPAEQEDYDALVHRFNRYCEPRRNKTFEKHVFRTQMQYQGELFDPSSRNVQLKAQSFNFGEPKDFMVRDQLDCGTTDKKLRARFLHEKQLM
ncbi:hypothetical protein HPB49_012695 [Dermacentor silvarum]|uniref:Uncharacterized protein n=1 Tax=Dermacentor silvarum TaxID=543639 RepID=A0ACB8D5H8_DERSI|nr:hypothetical protein HPB49_012695 [Dermacentor silvarum]